MIVEVSYTWGLSSISAPHFVHVINGLLNREELVLLRPNFPSKWCRSLAWVMFSILRLHILRHFDELNLFWVRGPSALVCSLPSILSCLNAWCALTHLLSVRPCSWMIARIHSSTIPMTKEQRLPHCCGPVALGIWLNVCRHYWHIIPLSILRCIYSAIHLVHDNQEIWIHHDVLVRYFRLVCVYYVHNELFLCWSWWTLLHDILVNALQLLQAHIFKLLLKNKNLLFSSFLVINWCLALSEHCLTLYLFKTGHNSMIITGIKVLATQRKIFGMLCLCKLFSLAHYLSGCELSLIWRAKLSLLMAMRVDRSITEDVSL